tara:strand:- start:44 stop:283 length:240 start_codon:yes stop_codon:yes gene_type:complete
MMWVDYAIDQAGENFTVRGDWPGEVMGLTQDGKYKGNHLYKPGDVFVVNKSGWLIKTDEVNNLLAKHEASKNGSSTSDK